MQNKTSKVLTIVWTLAIAWFVFGIFVIGIEIHK